MWENIFWNFFSKHLFCKSKFTLWPVRVPVMFENPVRLYGKVGKRWHSLQDGFFFLNSNPSMAFLSLLFFGVGVLNGSFPRILKVFFNMPHVIFFGGRTRNKRWTDWNEVKTMCKHDEMAGICTFFVSSKGLGVCLKGLEMSNYLSFLSAGAGFAYDDSFQKRFYRRISSLLSCMMNLKRNNMKLFVCWFELVFTNTVPYPKFSMGSTPEVS